MRRTASWACAALAMVMGQAQNTAGLLVVNGRIWTGEPARPWAEALAARGERLVAVGSEQEARRATGGGPRVIDARGRMVTPGFIDSHLHLLEGGFRLTAVQLREARSRQEFVDRIARYAGKLAEGAWVTGGDWDHENWGGQLPQRNWIDPVTPHNPVWVKRLDGHMGLANSLALKAAGVTRETPDPDGGAIVRDDKGEPTGVLKDNAMTLVERVKPEPGSESKDAAMEAAMRHVAGDGITSVHHMGSWADLEVFERARRAGRLRTRVYAAVPLATWERLRDRVRTTERGDGWLRTGLLKGFVDGSLGSRTAAFDEPFPGTPQDRGLLVNPPERLHEWIRGADAAGLHVAVHAIGDRANRILLDIYEKVAAENGPRDRRFRIEHAQHLSKPLVERLARAGVIASMQPYHAIDDGRWAEKVIGAERLPGMYMFASLLERRAHMAFGSDWFVAPPSVAMGLYAAVTRRTLDGKNTGGWVPREKIDVEAALRAYTAGGAYASFEEKEKGTLAPGKLADFVILNKDVTRLRGEELQDVKVDMTAVGGQIVYERQDR